MNVEVLYINESGNLDLLWDKVYLKVFMSNYFITGKQYSLWHSVEETTKCHQGSKYIGII